MTKIRDLRVDDIWVEHGHTRRITSTPRPVVGSYAFDTVLLPGTATEYHELPGDLEVETVR